MVAPIVAATAGTVARSVASRATTGTAARTAAASRGTAPRATPERGSASADRRQAIAAREVDARQKERAALRAANDNQALKKKISALTGGLMLAVALCIDAAQFILALATFAIGVVVTLGSFGLAAPLGVALQGIGIFAGMFLGIVGIIIFLVWFAILGVRILTGRRTLTKILTFGTASLSEVLPFLGGLPVMTLMVAKILHTVGEIDKEKAEEASAEQRQQAANDNAASTPLAA